MAEIGPGADAVARLVGFGRQLRARGLPVGTGRILTFVRAVGALGVAERDDVYWAGRASLVASRPDIDVFDAAFESWIRTIAPEGDLRIELDLPVPAGADIDWGEPPPDLEVRTGRTAASWSGAGEDDEPHGEASIRIVASGAEVLREKSFADLTGEEQEQVDALIRRLRVRVPHERTRRTRPASKGAAFDIRRTLRRSLRTQGEPFERAWRARGTRHRPLVLLLDVSGSMAPYSRALLQFAFAAMAAGRRVEVFVFGTRLTRVTRTLRTRDPDRALREIGRLVQDWEGGTRIGESVKTLLDGWSQRAALRGAIVVLCSDGLERGDPELLRAQMARLRRLAHRLVWVNPLKGSPRYEPLARGMAAALPSVDVFLSGHNLERVEELARVLGGRLARVIDDDARSGIDGIDGLEGDGVRGDRDGVTRSNRGFWVVATAIGMVCVVMVVAIFVNRSLKDTIAHTESDLNGALANAQRIRSSSGTFSDADAASLAAADDTRRYVGPDVASGGPGTVSVYASADEWAAAVQARPDACFFIKQAIGEDTRYAVATGACTGRAALAASDDRW